MSFGVMLAYVPDFTISDARYAKGMKIVRYRSGGMFKNRAARLAEALASRWTGRECGYIMSPKRAEKFAKLYAEGWDAGSCSGELLPPEHLFFAAVDDWHSGRAYMDNAGNFRVRLPGKSRGPIASWNIHAKACGWTCENLHFRKWK